MIRKSGDNLPPTSPGRRHFMGIVAAGTGRLSALAIPSLAILKTKDANAMGLFPKGNPGSGQGSGGGGGSGGPQCFARGTLIQTVHGEVPVQDLTEGTMVVTASGIVPVKWIGRQTMRKNASASWHPSVVPVRVSRFAIDEQTPQRDLYLSQEHCLLIEGVFIPVKLLVNGSSIAFDDDAKLAETIEYYSVELETHEVIFAEGMAVESFIYTGGRITWDNLNDYQDLYGEHKMMSACAPVCSYSGGRAELGGLVRLAASRFVDVRDRIQIAHDRFAARAMSIAA